MAQMTIGNRFINAVVCALDLHRGHYQKGAHIP